MHASSTVAQMNAATSPTMRTNRTETTAVPGAGAAAVPKRCAWRPSGGPAPSEHAANLRRSWNSAEASSLRGDLASPGGGHSGPSGRAPKPVDDGMSLLLSRRVLSQSVDTPRPRPTTAATPVTSPNGRCGWVSCGGAPGPLLCCFSEEVLSLTAHHNPHAPREQPVSEEGEVRSSGHCISTSSIYVQTDGAQTADATAMHATAVDDDSATLAAAADHLRLLLGDAQHEARGKTWEIGMLHKVNSSGIWCFVTGTRDMVLEQIPLLACELFGNVNFLCRQLA